MLSREEKNKDLEKEINHEKKVKLSKKIMKIFSLIFISFIIIFSYMYFVGTRFIKTKEYLIKDNIPNSFVGVKILHISDILYDSVNENDILSLENEIKLINPDIVFFTGNLFNKDYQISNNEIKILNNFMKNIPYKLGKYAVRGNCDNKNFDLIMDNTDFVILDNELTTIYNNDNLGIDIIGLNGNKTSINNNNNNYTITLINNYDLYHDYQISSNLVFSGNNLGGEIKIFNYSLVNNNKYMKDYYKELNTQVYISNGIGSNNHLRFMNHPSISVYRLYQ
mgnify:CR=1 FL=1